jgi:hypothetical protein
LVLDSKVTVEPGVALTVNRIELAVKDELTAGPEEAPELETSAEKSLSKPALLTAVTAK